MELFIYLVTFGFSMLAYYSWKAIAPLKARARGLVKGEEVKPANSFFKLLLFPLVYLTLARHLMGLGGDEPYLLAFAFILHFTYLFGDWLNARTIIKTVQSRQ